MRWRVWAWRTPAPNEDALMAQYAELSAFPENLGVLQALRQRGVATAILSNGSPEMLQSAVHSAGMSELLDAVLSVDSVRQFKTTPTSYQIVTDHFGFAPGRCAVCLEQRLGRAGRHLVWLHHAVGQPPGPAA
jgi:2-haloalkanoic acid dehalogenase type II